MPVTIIGEQTAPSGTQHTSAPLVEIKRTWNESWGVAPYLRFLRASLGTSREIGTCELERRYGPAVKEVYGSDYAAAVALDLRNYWVRVTMIAANGVPVVVWTGKITGETREIHADAVQPGGRQLFVAHEPLHILERITMANSIWRPDGMAAEDALTVGFLPAFNARDNWRMRAGNRSSATVGGTYVFGGSNTWTRGQMAAYVLEHFADEVDDDNPAASTGPGWVLGGQRNVLEEVRDIVPMGESISVADALRRLIDNRIGLDFKIVPTDFSGTFGGFEVQVFALSAVEASFGGEVMPRNARTITIRASQARQFEKLTMVRDGAHRYGRIRVMGKRIICGCSLRGVLVAGEDAPSLVSRWSAAIQDDYDAGGGGDDPPEMDRARTADKFAAVFQDYGAPDDWDHNQGAAAPVINNSTGELQVRTASEPGGVYGQLDRRRTLSFVPIDDPEGGFLAPQVWLWDEELERYVTSEAAGVYVSAAMDDWGVRIESSPNHLLGLNHFEAEKEVDPKYDFERFVATIAFETDTRVELIFQTGEVIGGNWKPSDGELVIEDDTAELWYIAAGTVSQVDQDGKLVTVNKQTIVRNDVRQLYRWMAGAIGRYVNTRGRADLVLRGWHPYSHVVGAILTVVDEGGDSHQLQAPVTGVEYTMSENGSGPQTIVRAGFAR
jgi:hypothetical protein